MAPSLIYGLRPYPDFIGLMGQFSTSPTPRPLSLFLGMGGLFSLAGAYGPPSHHQGPWPNPLYYGGFGLNGLFGPFRPPTVSTACGLWDYQAPFGPNTMRPKGPRGQLISLQGQVGPKQKVGSPEPVLAPKTNQPRNAQNTLGPQNWPRTRSGHNSVHGLGKPQEATSSAPSKDSPQVQGKTFPSSMHPTLKDPGVVHIW
ncbi:hypothetical protein O181_015237 [Austropuccinia psidii MF-1]|uniref:Uncharacterized protein n=1 Tax=Austropuccinia psidii MF-1 TaxID=1389203 RepID=A0A9Q3C1R3_9BASI|nr:hypothetical protein [Austropuccinia psidii MF-1]